MPDDTAGSHERGTPLRIANRWDWGAENPSGPQIPLAHPVTHIRYILNTGVPRCYNDNECKHFIREIQTKHKESGLEDIRYNFLVGEEGIVYEGRGWNIKPPKDDNFAEFDGKYLEIAFIGDYTKARFQTKWLQSVMFGAQWELVVFGFQNKYISEEVEYIPFDVPESKKVDTAASSEQTIPEDLTGKPLGNENLLSGKPENQPVET